MLTKTLIAAATGAVIVAALAGCSANGSGPKPSATPSSTATAQSTVYDRCVDGQATILASGLKKDFALTGDCSTVSIVGKAKHGTTITLPALDLLVIEGDGATVAAKSSAKIVFAGNDNTVTYAGTAEVDDQGSGNTATAE
jgi:hypothetical protein